MPTEREFVSENLERLKINCLSFLNEVCVSKSRCREASQQEAVVVKYKNDEILDQELCRLFGAPGSDLMDV